MKIPSSAYSIGRRFAALMSSKLSTSVLKIKAPGGEVKRWAGVQVNAWGASLEPQEYFLRTHK